MTANKTDEAIDATKPIDTDECADEYTAEDNIISSNSE